MEYEQALIVGKRRRSDAALALSCYVRERAAEVCAVKPAKGTSLDAGNWEPVGEENFKEICPRMGAGGDREAYLLVVDGGGTAKACTQRSYPLAIAVQMALATPLPLYGGPGGALAAELQARVMQKVQSLAELPEG